MIALTIFIVMVVALSNMTITAQRMAYQNVIQTAAYSVAQGYLEQIKSLPGTQVQRAINVGTVPLRTRSISALATDIGGTQVDDWLYPNTLNLTSLSDSLEVINEKEIMIDLDLSGGGEGVPQTMRMWIDVEVHPVRTQLGEAYLIDIQFAYEDRYLRGVPQTRTVWVRNGSGDYTQESRRLAFGPRNTGRLQVMSTLLNIDSLDTYLGGTFAPPTTP